MKSIDYHGEPRPRLAFPGGDLLLTVAGGGIVHLHGLPGSRFMHAGRPIALNPHFVLSPEGGVEPLLRAGEPSGPCFYEGLTGGDDLPAAELLGLYRELARGLADHLAADPDLLAHVRGEGAAADAARAEAELATAEEGLRSACASFVAAGRAAFAARARNGGGDAPEGAAFFLVAAIPDDLDERKRDLAKRATVSLAREACGPEGRLPGSVTAVIVPC